MSAGYYKRKNKKYFRKRHVKGMKIFMKKIKTISINMPVNDIENFLKKRNMVNMITKNIIIFQTMKNKD